MNNAPVNQPLASIARLIAENNDFTLIMHVSPDGDAIGSACALRLALMALADALMPCPVQHTAAKITMGKDCTIKSRTARMFT